MHESVNQSTDSFLIGECTCAGSFPYFDRCHEHGIAADEGIFTDLGRVLVNSIEVARDGTGANVDVLADFGVADVRGRSLASLGAGAAG